MRPDYGTRIYEYLFDPFDDYTRSAIMEDAVRVIQAEPRVELVNIDVYRDEHALTVLITLLFKPEAVTEELYVTYSVASDAAI
jgi:phage baseplate assembly protein W